MSEEDKRDLLGTVKALNPNARVIETERDRVPLESVLNTKRFDMEKAQTAARWIQELQEEHTPETDEYGISSFVFRARRPFHPARFWDFIHTEWEGLLRSKGYFWLASRYDDRRHMESSRRKCGISACRLLVVGVQCHHPNGQMMMKYGKPHS